jgi:hypothetical protein
MLLPIVDMRGITTTNGPHCDLLRRSSLVESDIHHIDMINACLGIRIYSCVILTKG